jgi:hypothetical protein
MRIRWLEVAKVVLVFSACYVTAALCVATLVRNVAGV